ncbi:hypothetical protein YN1_6700 [Nanoarchaeota archaeon]
MKSISPIISTILLIVIVVSISGLTYAFLTGMFNGLISSVNSNINKQSQYASFSIVNTYCSSNRLYFIIYNNGNIPIDINNSIITINENNNVISINGNNIICNNNIILPNQQSICYVNNTVCAYNSNININPQITINYNGVSESKNLGSGYTVLYFSNPIPIILSNNQNQNTSAPFQQDIAICNGTINLGNNFAYVNNQTLFNEINSNGDNVLFYFNNRLSYSWFEGQLNDGGVSCDVWWVNIPNGIPANSNITVYMGIGNNNYYQLFYPYVGASPQVIQGYDNGQYVFISYGYFNNTFDGWIVYQSSTAHTSYTPTITSNGIEMLNNSEWEGTFILPYNNEAIPEIPIIVEEAWYESSGADANTISLFGNTNNQIDAYNVNPTTCGGSTPASSSSTFVQFEYYPGSCNSESGPATYLKSAYTNNILSQTSFTTYAGTFYTYLIVNNTYAQTGWYQYSSNQVWVPLTLLDTYSVNYNNYTYANLNYSPFQYPTLEIGAGTGGSISYQYVEWVVARAYPPNGVMPSIYIS